MTRPGPIEYFSSEYLHGFPAEFSTEVNERVAIKQIGDLYRAKGGEAVILLFRLLFNETVTVIRPENMLGLSSARDDPFDSDLDLMVLPTHSTQSVTHSAAENRKFLVNRSSGLLLMVGCLLMKDYRCY